MLTDTDIIAAGRAVQHALPKLLAPAIARSLDRQLTEILDRTSNNPTASADAIETAIGSHPAAKLWFEAYLDQARSHARHLSTLPGYSTTPAEFELYACEQCDHLWLRESPHQPIPTCPNHPDHSLVPYTPPKS